MTEVYTAPAAAVGLEIIRPDLSQLMQQAGYRLDYIEQSLAEQISRAEAAAGAEMAQAHARRTELRRSPSVLCGTAFIQLEDSGWEDIEAFAATVAVAREAYARADTEFTQTAAASTEGLQTKVGGLQTDLDRCQSRRQDFGGMTTDYEQIYAEKLLLSDVKLLAETEHQEALAAHRAEELVLAQLEGGRDAAEARHDAKAAELDESHASLNSIGSRPAVANSDDIDAAVTSGHRAFDDKENLIKDLASLRAEKNAAIKSVDAKKTSLYDSDRACKAIAGRITELETAIQARETELAEIEALIVLSCTEIKDLQIRQDEHEGASKPEPLAAAVRTDVQPIPTNFSFEPSSGPTQVPRHGRSGPKYSIRTAATNTGVMV